MQAGPGLWTAKVADGIPLLRRLPYPLMVNECLLLLVLVCGNQQGGGQIWRTLSGKQVCPEGMQWAVDSGKSS